MKAFSSATRLAPWISASLALAVTSCSIVPSDPSFDSLSGSIVRRDQTPLVPGSVVVVQLEDMSGRARGDVVAEQRIERTGNLPITFRLKYDGGEIVPEHRYAVTAAVYADGEQTYTTYSPQSVLTAGGGNRVQLVLERINLTEGGELLQH